MIQKLVVLVGRYVISVSLHDILMLLHHFHPLHLKYSIETPRIPHASIFCFNYKNTLDSVILNDSLPFEHGIGDVLSVGEKVI